MNKIYFLTCVSLFLFGCATAPQKPDWIQKRKNIPELLEGVGYAPIESDRRVARDSAYNDAIQKLVLSGEIQVNGIIETRLSAHKDLLSGKVIGENLIDSITKTVYDTTLGKKYFKEYQDSKLKEYWVYVYIPVSTLNRITVEESINMLKKTQKKELNTIAEELEEDLQGYREKEKSEEQKIKQLLAK